ncbi:DUF5020 family protein [Maribellus sp. CM-23]|uniref:DUF5020 family protein n=1 Tax=Maribellus luteus TaxID=2305463 RepID=A0A399T150_9BACT|nr:MULTISPECIES: DUF5020 family protein [Maribellus]MCE4566692.1 DUF5020 family protein [Maribellus sp. CM-23]RIJ48532.1 DUF5020 family protein [Maribellus luteus]
MKRILLLFSLFAFAASTYAQNIQLHYDMGKDRKLFTSTVEMFRPDKYGSTFFFIDMDYSSDARNVDNGVSLAYWEIARAFKWNETQKFMPRVEYNGGVLKLDGDETPFIPIENCFLAGLERTWASADFSKILTLQANYKYIKDKEDASFQVTAVWTVNFLDGKMSFLGFADFWKEEMFWGTDFRFLSEPQLWYNFCKNFSAGTEIELSNNFVGDEFTVKPTLAVKYTF